MKTKITLGFAALIMTAIISSCSTSNDVASNKRIQKRKYNKGFFVSKNENVAFNKKKKDAKTIEFNDTETLTSSEAQVDKTVKTSEVSVIEETVVIAPVIDVKTTEVTTETSVEIASSNQVMTESIAEEQIKTANKMSAKKTVKKINKQSNKETNGFSGGLSIVLLIIIAFLLPPLAVALATQLNVGKTLLCLLLTILFYIPGLIYALVVVVNNK